MVDKKNTPETEQELEEENLSPEAEQEIVRNQLATIPEEEERKDIMKVVKTADIILIDSHKKKVKSFKARFPAKKYAIADDIVFDKDVYDKALDQWREVKNHRTKVAEVQFKSLKAPYIAITKYYNDQCNPIIADYKAVEKPISDFVDKLEALKKEDDERLKREALEKVNFRVKKCVDAGMVFDGSYYTIGSEKLGVDPISLGMIEFETMTEGIFDNIFQQIEEKAKIIAEAAEAEKQRLVAEKLEKEAADKAAKQKLADDQAAVAKKQKELDDAALLQKQKAANFAAKVLKMRLAELGTLGVEFNSSTTFFSYKGSLIFSQKMSDIEDEEWDVLIEKTFPQYIKEKEDAMAARQKEIEDAAAQKVIDDAMKIPLKLEEINEVAAPQKPTRAYFDTTKLDQQKTFLQGEYADLINDNIFQQLDQQKTFLQGDKIKYADFINQIKLVPIPEMQSEEYQSRVSIIITFINYLNNEL